MFGHCVQAKRTNSYIDQSNGYWFLLSAIQCDGNMVIVFIRITLVDYNKRHWRYVVIIKIIQIIFQIHFVYYFFFSHTDPPGCSNISCDQWCPFDSELIQNAATPTPTPSATDASGAKVKRAIPNSMRRAPIIITPGGYDDIRLRRDVETNDFASLVEYETPEDKTRAICCAKKVVDHCRCNYSKCKDVECESHESKILLQSDTNMPGRCCPTFICSSQKPSCYSTTLKHHFSVNETWNEDDCTHCECGEKGDIRCRSSVCKAISCEKKIKKTGQCCPECDFSDSKYCVGEEECDIHCRNGFDIDPMNGCTICRCAKVTTTTSTTTSSAGQTASTISSTSAPTDDNVYNASDNRTGAAPASTTDNWFVHSPIILGICITIAAFVIVVSLSCRYMTHSKGKHRLNRKQKNNNLTPLIWERGTAYL